MVNSEIRWLSIRYRRIHILASEANRLRFVDASTHRQEWQLFDRGVDWHILGFGDRSLVIFLL